MFARPPAASTVAGSKPTPSSRTSSVSRSPTMSSSTSILLADACLTAFCTASLAQKYSGRLQLLRVPADAVVEDRDRGGAGAHQAADRRRDALVGEHLRVDPPGELDQSRDRAVDGDTLRREHLPGPVRRPLAEGLGQPEIDDERDQVLLRPVVDVAFESPPLGVVRVDDASPRHLQLVGQGAQVVGTATQLHAQPGAAKRESRLCRESLEQTLLDRRQRGIVVFLQSQHAEPFVAQHHVERAEAGSVRADPGRAGIRADGPDRSQLRPVGDHDPDLGPPRTRPFDEQPRHPQRQVGLLAAVPSRRATPRTGSGRRTAPAAHVRPAGSRQRRAGPASARTRGRRWPWRGPTDRGAATRCARSAIPPPRTTTTYTAATTPTGPGEGDRATRRSPLRRVSGSPRRR